MRNLRVNHSPGQHRFGGSGAGGSELQVTACPGLFIAPTNSSSADERCCGSGDFTLMHAPSGYRIPVRGNRAALADLARRLAWFGEIIDPAYLGDPSNADACSSVREILRAWVVEQAEPALPPPSLQYPAF